MSWRSGRLRCSAAARLAEVCASLAGCSPLTTSCGRGSAPTSSPTSGVSRGSTGGGWLDDYPQRAGYVITPVVLWAGPDPPIKPAPDEVLAVYRIGLHALAGSEPRFIDIPESDRPVVQLPLGNDLIHAPTGAIL